MGAGKRRYSDIHGGGCALLLPPPLLLLLLPWLGRWRG